jgi:hypothetical protein
MNTPPPNMPGASNPHAGMDMGGGAGGANPHAGMDMGGGGGGGTDVSQLGLPPPDPSRAIDPTHVVAGVIKVDAKVKELIKAGGALFVTVKKADAAGAASGPPLAVEKLSWGDKDEVAFQLTEAQAMIGGTQLTGDVVVSARFDQDGDALSKQPGDVTGTARVTVPSKSVVVSLDSVLP